MIRNNIYHDISGPLMTALVMMVLALFLFHGQAAYAASGKQEHITAVVNDEAVSRYDVTARMKMIMESANMPDSDEIKDKLMPQIVDMLIEESLKLQEAKRLGLEISEAEIERGFAGIAKQNNMTADQFRQVLERQDVPPDTLKRQIEAQIAWQKVVSRRLRPRVDVPENQVESMLERLEGNVGKTEYLISEIFLPIKEGSSGKQEKKMGEEDTKQLAERLVMQMIQEKARFGQVASQFSQSVSAARGGDMGWVQGGQLPEEIQYVLSQMAEKELSRPIRTEDGYHIILLRAKRTISQDTLPSEEQIRQQLGMEHLERLQRGYLMDLKTSAFIERRV